MAKFDVAVIYNCEEIVAVVPGKGEGLVTSLKKNEHWDSLMEEVSINPDEITNRETLEKAFSNQSDFNLKLDIINDIDYHFR